MKEAELIEELIGEIQKSRLMLEKIDAFYRDFKENDFRILGKKRTTGIVLAEIVTDFYTCLETLFLRISQFFENSLKPDKWHSDLLRKMTINIQGVRKAVISDQTYPILLELMKFRHFKRYYFEFDYDWDKLEFLEKKYNDVRYFLNMDLDEFEAFLEQQSQDKTGLF